MEKLQLLPLGVQDFSILRGSISGFAGYFLSMIYVPSLRMAIFFNFIATFFWCTGIIWYTLRHKEDLKDK